MRGKRNRVDGIINFHQQTTDRRDGRFYGVILTGSMPKTVPFFKMTESGWEAKRGRARERYGRRKRTNVRVENVQTEIWFIIVIRHNSTQTHSKTQKTKHCELCQRPTNHRQWQFNYLAIYCRTIKAPRNLLWENARSNVINHHFVFYYYLLSSVCRSAGTARQSLSNS